MKPATPEFPPVTYKLVEAKRNSLSDWGLTVNVDLEGTRLSEGHMGGSSRYLPAFLI